MIPHKYPVDSNIRYFDKLRNNDWMIFGILNAKVEKETHRLFLAVVLQIPTGLPKNTPAIFAVTFL
jgi:hypothetical protein